MQTPRRSSSAKTPTGAARRPCHSGRTGSISKPSFQWPQPAPSDCPGRRPPGTTPRAASQGWSRTRPALTSRGVLAAVETPASFGTLCPRAPLPSASLSAALATVADGTSPRPPRSPVETLGGAAAPAGGNVSLLMPHPWPRRPRLRAPSRLLARAHPLLWALTARALVAPLQLLHHHDRHHHHQRHHHHLHPGPTPHPATGPAGPTPHLLDPPLRRAATARARRRPAWSRTRPPPPPASQHPPHLHDVRAEAPSTMSKMSKAPRATMSRTSHRGPCRAPRAARLGPAGGRVRHPPRRGRPGDTGPSP